MAEQDLAPAGEQSEINQMDRGKIFAVSVLLASAAVLAGATTVEHLSSNENLYSAMTKLFAVSLIFFVPSMLKVFAIASESGQESANLKNITKKS